MKLKHLLLCKTPFTPSYEHLVTGCSSREFYFKLYNDVNNTTSINIEVGDTLAFRTVRESDNEIVFSLNLNSIELNYFKPYQFNYVATYETDGSNRFWFIDSYDLDNSMLNPSVTFYCSIDYWHSYCLISQNNFISQRINRLTQNGLYQNSNVYFYEDNAVPHRVSYTSKDRILWGRVRFNTLPYSSKYNENIFGTDIDGSLCHAYLPLGVVIDNKINFFAPLSLTDTLFSCQLVMSNNYKEIQLLKGGDMVTNDRSSGNIGDHYYTIKDIWVMSNFSPVVSFDLTYLPPFNYSIFRESRQIAITIHSKCNAVLIPDPYYTEPSTEPDVDQWAYLITCIDDGSTFTQDIDYNITIPQVTAENPDTYFYNRFPYHYYSAIVGGREFTFNYPVHKISYRITNNGSGNSNSCDLYINDELVHDNIDISLTVPLPINKDQAGDIELIYGSGYRASQAIAKYFSPLINSMTNFTPTNIISNITNMALEGHEIKREDNKPSSTYAPISQSSQISYGDFPFIKEYIPIDGYEKCIKSYIKMKGESVDFFAIPIFHEHRYFDYVRTKGAEIMTTTLNGNGNKIISNAFNRGVYLWHYDAINNIATDVGYFYINNFNLQ